LDEHNVGELFGQLVGIGRWEGVYGGGSGGRGGDGKYGLGGFVGLFGGCAEEPSDGLVGTSLAVLLSRKQYLLGEFVGVGVINFDKPPINEDVLTMCGLQFLFIIPIIFLSLRFMHLKLLQFVGIDVGFAR
jgi:hypothetical protein